MSTEVVIAIITTLGGSATVGALITWLRERGKDQVTNAERWEKMIDRQNDRLEEELSEVKIELRECQMQCARLSALIEDMIDQTGANEFRHRLRIIKRVD